MFDVTSNEVTWLEVATKSNGSPTMTATGSRADAGLEEISDG